jgi:hypothetical protein
MKNGIRYSVIPVYTGRYIPKLEALLNTTEEVGQLPYNVSFGASVSTSGTVNIFGGSVNADGILSFNMETFISEEVGSLPMTHTLLASVQFKNIAYIFGAGSDTTEPQSVMSVNLNTLQIETGRKDFPYIN